MTDDQWPTRIKPGDPDPWPYTDRATPEAGELAKQAGIESESLDTSADAATVDTFDAKRFILAGKAIFTLQGRMERYTYRVSRSDDGRALFVGMLTGPDNLADYTYLGMLDERTGKVRLTRASRYTDDSTPVKAIRWALGWIWKDGAIPEPAKLYHAGRCGRCGRTLTVPSSVESGFGPECIAML